MSAIEGFMFGLASSWSLSVLFYMLIGICLGFIVGALPGLNPSTAMAILIPITFGIEPLNALVMLLALYYGGLYAGAITAIMINNPGTTAAIVTAIEGYPLAKRGKCLPAMRIALISSFFGGLIGIIILIFLANPIMEFALNFGPPERFSLITMAFLMVGLIGGKSLLKSVISVIVGLLIAVVGRDVVSGQARLVFGIPYLYGGISFVAVIIGVFAISEILISLETRQSTHSSACELTEKWPSKAESLSCIPSILRGSLIGFIIGVIPAAGPQIATWVSYGIEKIFAKDTDPIKSNLGSLKGVAVAESSNNASKGGAMVTLLTLGIPGSTGTAVLLGAFMLHGLRLGPMLFTDSPEIAWGLISNMFIGQFFCIVIALALVPLFSLVLKISYSVLYPLILVIASIGAYSLENSFYPTIILVTFGIIGYFMRKTHIPIPPLILGLILGPMWETAFKQSLTISRGNYLIFMQRPISVTFLIITVLSLIIAGYFKTRKKKIINKI